MAFLLESTRKEPREVRFDFGPRPGFSKRLFGSSREGTELDWTDFLDSSCVGRTPRGSCNRTLLRRVLRRFSRGSSLEEVLLRRVLRRRLVRVLIETEVLRRVLRRGCVIEGA